MRKFSKKKKKNHVKQYAISQELIIFQMNYELSNFQLVQSSNRLYFKKINIISIGLMPKMNGAICNVPALINEISPT